MGTILAYSVMKIEQRELKKKRGKGENIYFCVFSDEEQQEPKQQSWIK
jgi:tRNA A37 threonylcarbamoyladenosine dehydratase